MPPLGFEGGELCLDGVELGGDRLRQVVVGAAVRLREFVVAGRERVAACLLRLGQRRPGRPDATAAPEGVRRLTPDRHPPPALRAHRLGFGLHPPADEFFEDGGVGDPAAAVLREQIALHAPAGRLVGVQPDERHAPVRGGQQRVGEQPADGRRCALPLCEAGEDALLRLPVVGHGEGGDVVEGESALAVGRDDGGRDGGGEAEPLAHGVGGDAEAGGDLLHAEAVAAPVQPGEGLELVGRVHVLPDHVLREARLRRVLPGVAVEHAAGHGDALRQPLRLRQQPERREP
ncbi:hypothetical protein ACX4M7_10535, partial [Roseomonas mucosa]